MSDDATPDDPIPGWPAPSEPGSPGSGPAAPWTPPGADPTTPAPGWAPPPGSTPPPAGPPPGYGPPPGTYGAPGGYGPPGAGGAAPSGYPPSGYGYGYDYGAPAPRDHPQGTTILVLGILSIPLTCVCIGVVLGIVAWVMGNSALKEIDRQPSAYTNRGNVNAGRICGMVAVGLFVLGFVLRIVGVLAFSANGSY